MYDLPYININKEQILFQRINNIEYNKLINPQIIKLIYKGTRKIKN